MKSFDVQKYLLYMDIYRITFMASVPAILATLAKQPNPGRWNLHAVETVVSGSAPLNPELGQQVEKIYLRPGVTVKQGWGMTETTCSITGFAPDDEDDGRSIGWLNPNCAARIQPVEGRDFNGVAPCGALVGEIWVAGPNIMKRYYKNPKGTAETIVESHGFRWLRTGDIGYIDDRGCIYIVDRLKVSPPEGKALSMQTYRKTTNLSLLGTHQGQGITGGSSRARTPSAHPPRRRRCSCGRC